MKRIYDWDARFQLRNYTAADILALKGKQKLVQTTANTTEEATAAREAGIDLIMGNAQNTAAVREGAPDLFFTAALGLPDYPTESSILDAAFTAMKAGADSIYTARGPHIVELLAREKSPSCVISGLFRGNRRGAAAFAQSERPPKKRTTSGLTFAEWRMPALSLSRQK